jgi:hypothetical protein
MDAISRAAGFARHHNKMLVKCLRRDGHKMAEHHAGQRDAWMRRARSEKALDSYYADRNSSGLASLAH